MLNIHSFLQKVCGFIRSIPKKVYRTCAVIASGTFILSVIVFASNDYGGSGKNRATTAYVNLNPTSGEEATEEDETEAKIQAEITNLADEPIENIPEQVETTASAEEAAISTNNLQGVIQLSAEDYEVLLRIVEAEATGQDEMGKILVANVVLNRVNNESFPDTVKEVVFQNNGGVAQFTPTIDGRYYSVTVSDSTIESVNRALSGEDYSQGALFFTASRESNNWFSRNLTYLFSYGGHSFYIK